MNKNGKRKAEQLMLHLANKLQHQSNYCFVLLNKLFWHIDNLHYAKFGESVTHFGYVKKPQGPTPDPHVFYPFIRKMAASGWLKEVEEIAINGRVQKKVLALKEAKMELFSGEELKVIERVVSEMRNFTGTGASEDSHTYTSWKVAKLGEAMPFESYSLTHTVPTPDDIKWSKDEAAKRAV
ncbi:MAG: hypothetical protein COB88_07930 [Flavobacteriales bacterium]|nr:MAG: hypothetical protein COB88_07930 [Flavobacteriales bacterium]